MPPSSPNSQQIDYWNASAGETWAQFHEQLDRQLSPRGSEALRAVAPSAGERIVDIGCDCGQSSMGLARRVGPVGSVVGIDISSQMLEIARAKKGS